MTKNEIIVATKNEFLNLTTTCQHVETSLFYTSVNNKWSVADNVKHLLISTNMSALAFWLPKFLVRWMAGKPNRPSKSYEELLSKYKQKLAEGGVAGARFTPKPTKDVTKKESLFKQWEKVTTHYITSLTKNRTEEDLDNFLIRHPLLGKITLRELCYFTIFHTQHHLQSIKTIIGNS